MSFHARAGCTTNWATATTSGCAWRFATATTRFPKSTASSTTASRTPSPYADLHDPVSLREQSLRGVQGRLARAAAGGRPLRVAADGDAVRRDPGDRPPVPSGAD